MQSQLWEVAEEGKAEVLEDRPPQVEGEDEGNRHILYHLS